LYYQWRRHIVGVTLAATIFRVDRGSARTIYP
jgi:hypothetical protein